jgi:hypothetical protein
MAAGCHLMPVETNVSTCTRPHEKQIPPSFIAPISLAQIRASSWRNLHDADQHGPLHPAALLKPMESRTASEGPSCDTCGAGALHR